MATKTLTLYSKYVAGGVNWSNFAYNENSTGSNNGDNNRFYIGLSSSWRAKFYFTTPSDISSISKVTLGFKGDYMMTPLNIRAFLSTQDTTNANTDNISASYVKSVSYLYKDKNKSAREVWTGNTPTAFSYFVFDSLSLSANTTYYIYVNMYGTAYGENTNNIGSNSTDGYVRGRNMPGWSELEITYTSQHKLTITGDSGVASITGSGWYNHGAVARTVARAKAGYHLTKYTGTKYDGSGEDTWTSIEDPFYDEDSWTMNADRTVLTHTEPNIVYIAYHPNGGTITNSGYDLNEYGYVRQISDGNVWFDYVKGNSSGDPYNASTFGLVKSGYTFGGWYICLNEQPTSTVLDQDTTYPASAYTSNDDSSKNTDNTTLVRCYLMAKWTPLNNDYTLTIDPVDGALIGDNFGDSNGEYVASAQVTVTYGSSNYYQLGTAKNGKYDVMSTTTVTFDGNGGTPAIFKAYSGVITEYIFKGFYTSESGGTQVFDANGHGTIGTYWTSSHTWNYRGNLTIYAQYGGNTHPLYITLPSATRPGYKFLGWNTSSNDDTPEYIEGEEYEYTITSNPNITLYAIWEPLGYIYIDNGTTYEKYQIFIDNGTTWEQYIPYIDSGTSWIACS